MLRRLHIDSKCVLRVALEAFVNISDNKTTNVQVDNQNLTTPSTLFTSIKSSFHKRQRRRRKRNCKCRELLNRTQVLNKELPKLLHKENVPESEIGQIEFLQKPFYVFLT
ncbi:uncharacterized protein LOC130445804 [Diorhabda sublineata]|uniref:uncharacterized protein LOC130445804 n=1 Tax=Diorhabda sublineata TaxID=1163346 RepID=UPI0024E13C8D|nr:uncharacterized protein LOC130445804 [Diorhabda sublineata]